VYDVCVKANLPVPLAVESDLFTVQGSRSGHHDLFTVQGSRSGHHVRCGLGLAALSARGPRHMAEEAQGGDSSTRRRKEGIHRRGWESKRRGVKKEW
jgi:hypothetical protein